MRVLYSKRFKKQYHLRLSGKLKEQFKARLALFLIDPRHPQLRTHALAGKYDGCWSFNISGDVRAIFQYQNNQKTVLFLLIGGHSQIYG